MKCPNCKKDIGDPMETCEYDPLSVKAGAVFNATFAMIEHWWSVALTHAECGHTFEHTDSSL